MALSVSYNRFDLDSSAFEDATKLILQRASKQGTASTNNILSNTNLSIFTRAYLGKDLYKVNAEEARELSILKTQLNVVLSSEAISAINYLKVAHLTNS